ncbi:MAG TPA: hypothetical protein VGC74_08540 [Stenotrophomonas sp.]|jgi:hypothetical protein
MRKLRLSSSLLTVAITLVVAGCTSTPPAAPAAAVPAGPRTIDAARATLQGTITAIDQATRTVTIRGANGAELEVAADNQVRNFNQLKVGDQVSLDYMAAVAVELQPAGSAQVGVSSAQGGTVAAPGNRPGGTMSNTVSIVTEVVAVDPVANTIALRGPRGNTQIIAVQRPDLRAKLPGVTRGDMLRISYTEAVALNIRPTP